MNEENYQAWVNKTRNMKLRDSLATLEDWIVNGRLGKIVLTMAPDWDENNSIPVIDYSIKDTDGDEIIGDLNFHTLEEALLDIGKRLDEKEQKL